MPKKLREKNTETLGREGIPGYGNTKYKTLREEFKEKEGSQPGLRHVGGGWSGKGRLFLR